MLHWNDIITITISASDQCDRRNYKYYSIFRTISWSDSKYRSDFNGKSKTGIVFFAIFVLILQQFDGNFLGPKILGNKTGLSSFWVIFSITLFGGYWGFWVWQSGFLYLRLFMPA